MPDVLSALHRLEQGMFDLFRRYRFLFLVAALLLATVVLYSYNLRKKNSTTYFERAALTFAAPFQTAIDSFIDNVSGIWSDYVWLVDTRQQNLDLERENRRLSSELNEMHEMAIQNGRLRRLLAFVDDLDMAALPAQVIGEDAGTWARTLIIDKGSNSGLRSGLAVVSADGVVGRIIKTAPTSARVLLVTDGSSAVASLIQRTRARGVARGRGDDLSVEYSLRSDDIRVGDLLVTSGMGGIFPKGLPLGRVATVEKDQYGLFQRLSATTTVDFAHLEEVLVVLGERE
jgi:rod shape-determining protein MreC